MATKNTAKVKAEPQVDEKPIIETQETDVITTETPETHAGPDQQPDEATELTPEAPALKPEQPAVEIVTEVAPKIQDLKAETEPEKPIKPQNGKADPIRELAMSYAKHYPSCPAFHITSDRQVFLSGDLSAAVNHQRTLEEGELRTIKF